MNAEKHRPQTFCNHASQTGTQINVTVKALENEFWPLEGVKFDAQDDNPLLTVACHIYGPDILRGYVALRFLTGIDTEIVSVRNSESLLAFCINGDIESINRTFLGFGLVFKKDFEHIEDLTIVVEGSKKYTFLIGLAP